MILHIKWATQIPVRAHFNWKMIYQINSQDKSKILHTIRRVLRSLTGKRMLPFVFHAGCKVCCFHPWSSTHVQNRTPWHRVQKPWCQTTGLKMQCERHALISTLVFMKNVDLAKCKHNYVLSSGLWNHKFVRYIQMFWRNTGIMQDVTNIRLMLQFTA